MPSFEKTLLQVSNMDVLEGLPASLRAIPEQIAASMGIEVQVLPISALSEPSAFLEKAEISCDVNGDKGTITIWCKPYEFTSSMLGHELIHLRRKLVEQVPMLMPLRTASEHENTMIYLFENEMEHLFIIPEEIQLFPDAEERWAEQYRDRVKSITQASSIDPFELVFTWTQLRLSLPNQIELGRALGQHLRSLPEGWVNTVDYFRHDMAQALPNKHRVIDILKEFVGRDGTFTSRIMIKGQHVVDYDGKLIVVPVSDTESPAFVDAL